MEITSNQIDSLFAALTARPVVYSPSVEEADANYWEALRAARDAKTVNLADANRALADEWRYFIHSVDGLGA